MPWGMLHYMNDPPKGGCMASTPVLDLTTSLRGDFSIVQLSPSPELEGGRGCWTRGRGHEAMDA